MGQADIKRMGIWFPTVRAGTGADVFTLRLVSALQQRGCRAEITWLPHRAEYAPWSVSPPSPPPWATIVHINSWLHNRFIPPNLPVVVTLHSCVHDPAFMPYKNLPRRLYHRLWVKHCEARSMARADATTAVSRYTAQRAMEAFGRTDIIPIHNWIDTNRFSPLERQKPHHPFRLLFVGKPSKRKGADLLPEIMRKLGPDFELRFTGTEEELSVYGAIPPNIIPLGRIHNEDVLIEAYRTSDALLFPTRLEGMSLVTLEAHSCGLPIIGTYASSMPEVVEDGKTGHLCIKDKVSSFVEAAAALKNNSNIWIEMKDAARNRALKFFNAKNIISSYLDIYARIFQEN